jgi:hypothetical protein
VKLEAVIQKFLFHAQYLDLLRESDSGTFFRDNMRTPITGSFLHRFLQRCIVELNNFLSKERARTLLVSLLSSPIRTRQIIQGSTSKMLAQRCKSRILLEK